MGGLAGPQDLFLDLGEPFEAKLHREITTSENLPELLLTAMRSPQVRVRIGAAWALPGPRHPTTLSIRLEARAHRDELSRPRLGVIVHAVEPDHVHAVGNNPATSCGSSAASLGRGHHDPRRPSRGGGAEKPVGVAGKEFLPFGEHDARYRYGCCFAGQLGEKSQDGFDRRQHVGLAATERRQPERTQSCLEIEDVVVPQRHIVDQVRR